MSWWDGNAGVGILLAVGEIAFGAPNQGQFLQVAARHQAGRNRAHVGVGDLVIIRFL